MVKPLGFIGNTNGETVGSVKTIEAAKWIYKNAGSAGQVDSRYKHGAPGRRY